MCIAKKSLAFCSLKEIHGIVEHAEKQIMPHLKQRASVRKAQGKIQPNVSFRLAQLNYTLRRSAAVHDSWPAIELVGKGKGPPYPSNPRD